MGGEVTDVHLSSEGDGGLILERLPEERIPSNLAAHMNAVAAAVPRFTDTIYREPHDLRRLDRVLMNVGLLSARVRRFDSQLPFTILEIGCAEGRMTEGMALFASFIEAVDFCPEMIARCKPIAKVQYHVRDIEAWTPSGTDDLIVISEVLEHLRNPQAVIDRLIPHCRHLLATCPISESLNPEGTFDANLLGRESHQGDASGHVWAMDMEGFKSWFDKYEIVHEEIISGVNGLVIVKGGGQR